MLVLAFIICGLKFPFIGRGPDLSGIPADTWPRIREPGKWIHDMTNLGVEAVRADCQFFAKLFSFIIIAQFAALALLIFTGV